MRFWGDIVSEGAWCSLSGPFPRPQIAKPTVTRLARTIFTSWWSAANSLMRTRRAAPSVPWGDYAAHQFALLDTFCTRRFGRTQWACQSSAAFGGALGLALGCLWRAATSRRGFEVSHASVIQLARSAANSKIEKAWGSNFADIESLNSKEWLFCHKQDSQVSSLK